MRYLPKTIYDPSEATEALQSVLESLDLARYDFLKVWLEVDGAVLATLDDQESVEEGLPVLAKLFSMRGRAMLLSKIIGGARWVQRPTSLELDEVFKGQPGACAIKFQGVRLERAESSPKKPRPRKKVRFVRLSRTFDLDSEIDSYFSVKEP